MFKKIIAAIFLLAFFMQTFSKAVIVFSFYANQKYIAQNLCENKSKPQMKCCGKCQLKKKLSQEDKNDQKNSGSKQENKNEVVSSKTFFLTYHFTVKVSAINHLLLSAADPIDKAFTIFHLPLLLIVLGLLPFLIQSFSNASPAFLMLNFSGFPELRCEDVNYIKYYQ